MTVNEKPVVHIIGMGSMGAIIAMNLMEHTQCEIVPLFRNIAKCERFVKDANSSITINRIYSEYEGDNATISHKIERYYAPEIYPTEEPIRNLIVATKTYQTQNAIKPYLPYINSETNLILVQNGLGVLEQIKDGIFAPETNQERPQLFQGVIAHGAFQLSEFTFNHACDADFKIARLPWSHLDMVQPCELVTNDSSNNELMHLFTDSTFAKLFHVSHLTYQEMLIGQLVKFLGNSCINSVTATVDALNGELLDCCRETFTSIVEESLSILKTVYKPLFDYEKEYNDKNSYPSLNISRTFELGPLVDGIVYLCCVQGGKNSTSMRQDTLNLRDTEIDYINGFVVKMADKFEMGPNSSKVNKTIMELVNLRSGLNRARAREDKS
ncbi:2-dehydropantoate 2-reductase [Monosporozyma servazzii]